MHMYGALIRWTAKATSRDDLVKAVAELESQRTSYKFSDNKGKTAAQIIWEHIVIANRWGGDSPAYWTVTEAKAEELWTKIADFIDTKSNDQDNIRELAGKAIQLSAGGGSSLPDPGLRFVQSNTLWDVRQERSCGLLTVLSETFRKIDSTAHYR